MRRDPQSADAWLALANFHVRTGDAPGPRAAIEKAAALTPENADVQLLLAAYDHDAGQRDSAERRVRALLDQPADGWKAHIAQAAWLAADATTQLDALEHARKAMALRPAAWQALVALGRVQEARGELAEANAAYTRAVERAPHEMTPRLHLVRSLLTDGDAIGAVRVARGLATEWPTAANIALLAQSMRASGDIDGARRLLTRTIAQSSVSDAPLRIELGDLELAAGRRREARTAYRGVEARDAIRPLTTIDISEGRVAEARRRVDEVPARHPNDASALIAAAQVALAERRGRAAFAALEKAIASAPGDSDAREIVAQLYLVSGDRTSARRELEWLVAHQTRPASALTALGMIDAADGDRAAAARDYERALVNPRAGAATNNLAWICAGEGRLDEAVRLVTIAEATLGPRAEVLDTRARISSLRRGRWPELPIYLRSL